MQVQLKYGDRLRSLTIPEKAEVVVLSPATVPPLEDPIAHLNQALDAPLERPAFERLLQNFRPKTVAIAIPDETRPTPVKLLLPVVLTRLFNALPALKPDQVTLVVGGGLHPPLNEAGLKRVVPPDLARGCRVIAHDASRSALTDYGTTHRGTPIRINAEYARADFKIVIGQIDPHQFVGFTGGAKGVVIGCAAADMIEHNHGLMFDDRARVGGLDGNPVREDMNEAGRRIGIDLAVNVVLDPEKRIVGLWSGDPEAVLRKGAETCAAVYGVGVDERFDIMVASCGGYPKDICLYQAQKGLNLASQAVKHGGKILLLAACPQGVGDDIYFDYVCQFATPQEALNDFKKLGFKMGAHKSYLFGRTLTNFEVAIASDLDPGTLRACHMRAADPELIIKEWVDDFPGRPRVGVVPNANTTYFHITHGRMEDGRQ